MAVEEAALAQRAASRARGSREETPSTRGFARPGGREHLPGLDLDLRDHALDARAPPRGSPRRRGPRARRSCGGSPASSFSRSKRLSFTTTLRRPIASMISRAWRSAPAPIESIAITAPTPKMMPSMARNERSAWWRRLSRPEPSASRESITGPASPARPTSGRPRERASRVGSRRATTSPGREALVDHDARDALPADRRPRPARSRRPRAGRRRACRPSRRRRRAGSR